MKPDLCTKIVVLAVCFAGIACPNMQGQTAAAVEAQTAANRLWSLIVAHCGDSYYSRNYNFVFGEYIRFQNPSFSPPIANRLSPADRENGYSWRGFAVIKGLTYHVYDAKSGWGDAKDSSEIVRWYMWNLKGQWHASTGSIGGSYQINLDAEAPTINDLSPAAEATGRSRDAIPLHKLSCRDVPWVNSPVPSNDPYK
jgi:hypothetical protein